MARFIRCASDRWHAEVPGTRWFRADLHVHTLDDHPNANLQRPSGVDGPATDAASQTAYAKALLHQACSEGIEVLGLTPHAVCAGDSDDTSATWRIVDVWNTELDEDGVPFRDKIYAVFPGFEPSLADGTEGLHLLFLFDPEIGRQNYVHTFATIMGAVSPYQDRSLRISTLRAEQAFAALAELSDRDGSGWQCMCLAAHAFGNRGLFRLKSQVLEHFPHEHICGLQLKDEWLPPDAFADKLWLEEGMAKYHHAFFHASDAYNIEHIGRRFSCVKLASPRIESLRQALLASDSRMRLPYEKGADGSLVLSVEVPEAVPASRAWVSQIRVSGGTSFFGGHDPEASTDREQVFEFSPDLTCVIGGRMSGKSTLLDGLRVHCERDLPVDARLKEDVLARGQEVFLSGGPDVVPNIHGPVPRSSPVSSRWPARFFTQRELQRVVEDQDMRRHILHRLIPTETRGLVERELRLSELDTELAELHGHIQVRRTSLLAAQGELDEIERAEEDLKRFEKAGIDRLRTAQCDSGKVNGVAQAVANIRTQLLDADEIGSQLTPEAISDDEIKRILDESDASGGLSRVVEQLTQSIQWQGELLDSLADVTLRAQAKAGERVIAARAAVQRALVEAGGTPEELNQFDALTEIVANREQMVQQVSSRLRRYRNTLREFAAKHRERSALIGAQREAMARVAETIVDRFSGRIRINCIQGGLVEPLDSWVSHLRTASVTRWWNSVKADGLYPATLRAAIRKNTLSELGMSSAVQEAFTGTVDLNKRMELASLRSEDRYAIELKVGEDDGDYRELTRLSGGAQVSVLLSLILETDDATPLVVDQPEDEADKEFLLKVLLPALRRLKGSRQIVFATHDANIVVNGDADQVIVLEADADTGSAKYQGAIEDANVKNAIVRILDGGEEAFELRKAKYGF